MAKQDQGARGSKANGAQTGEVVLYKDKPLGTGAFGQVYRAKYKCTPCAAKIIHPTLYLPPGARLPDSNPHPRLPLERFEQEIELLVRLRHPNIVQHLCVYSDPHTLGPVLLMELLICNLTDFLQKDMSKAIAYNVQISLSQDVCLALAYLHLEGIIHRDLSGNNILIGRGDVAKLSDFGMAKLLSKGFSHLTMLPGTDVYMPPEAVAERPNYTEKIDCFSFGVVLVQILTQLYPEPGDRRREVHVISVKGKVEVTIEEVERRQNHIGKVKKDHPLLSIALKCLADNPDDRPSAKDLCEKIEALKLTDDCILKSDPTTKLFHEEQGLGSHYSTEMERPPSKSELTSQPSATTAIERDYDIIEGSQQFPESGSRLEKQMTTDGEQSKGDSKWKDTKSEATESVNIEEMERAAASIGLNFKWKSGGSAPCEMCRHSDSVINKDTVYILPANSRKIFVYNMTIRTWSELAKCPYIGSSLAVINGHLTTIGGKRVETGYRYTVNATAGYASSYSDILCSHVKKQDGTEEWVEKFPRMPTKRAFTTALKIDSNLLVAGGVGGDILKTVEILNTRTREWMRSQETDLPEPMWAASASLCNGSIFMLGGRDRNGVGLDAAYSCSLESFLLSCRPKSITARLSHVFTLNKPSFSVWNKMTAVPVALSTCMSVRGQLLAVGGLDTICSEPTAKIHVFDQSTDKWIAINHMPVARSSCFVFSHPDNEHILYVVGGKGAGGGACNEVSITV